MSFTFAGRLLGLLAALCLALSGSVFAQDGELSPQAAALLTVFTYQGYLEQSGVPYTGVCDGQFSLYDAPTAGAQIGSALTSTNISVSGGIFNLQLDFGAAAFNGQDRYIAVSVRCPAGSGAYTPLTPRQPITPVPASMYANRAPWGGLQGVPAGFTDGVDNTGADWALAGNAGTNPASNFVGTTDNQPLEFRVNNARVMRYEPNASSPSIIGGFSGNSVTTGAYGATIAGGGTSSTPNRVTDSYGTIGGGGNNQAGDNAGTTVDRIYVTVSGGFSNNASGSFSGVGGGRQNTASGFAAVISGGQSNTASNSYTTVGGGVLNSATGGDATIGGGYQNSASGSEATVGGGQNNIASGGLATVGGGQQNFATNTYATVSGGYGSLAYAPSSTVSGGYTNTASGDSATVIGGAFNTASGVGAAVGGGRNNTASGDYSFAAGYNASADQAHSFVWSGTINAGGTASFGAGSFTARAPGGVRFYTTDTGTGTGVQLAAGGGAWASLSDRNVKENFANVDTRAVLDALVALPITTWNYITQDDAIRHMGVMAQDFYAAFNVGEDDTHITTIDADGVLIAAVQGLNAKLESENADLRAQNADMEARLARLEALAGSGEAFSAAGMLGVTVIGLVVMLRRRGTSKV